MKLNFGDDLECKQGRKKVLVIGMLNSIHFSNWLSRFKNEDIDFFIYPSRQYRKIDPNLKKLISEKQTARYVLVRKFPTINTSNFLDFALETKWLKFISPNFRAKGLISFLKRKRMDFIHALEIQNAGYLLLKIHSKFLENSEVIVTNWGSDIFYYSKFSEHEEKIRKVLRLADRYSAECFRDYKLATKLDFVGRHLPLIPNSFFFEEHDEEMRNSKASTRNLVVVKGYGGEFGQVQIVIEVIEKLLESGTDFSFFFYSVTPDIEPSILELQSRFSSKIDFVSIKKKISKIEMADRFRNSRVYIGCSKSDGISTSFLEALQHGSYPIQTNTSCASEWVLKGVVASLINPSAIELRDELIKALKSDELVNHAQDENLKVVLKHLNSSEVFAKSKLFYDIY
jgi:glycosyltransferase involved in cell wall biosynthesis